MDTVINRLRSIEETAGAIVDEANVRKKAFAKEMEERIASFDSEMERDTARRIAEIQQKMETDLEARLGRQKAGFEALLGQLEDNYNLRHAEYTEALFRKMIEG